MATRKEFAASLVADRSYFAAVQRNLLFGKSDSEVVKRCVRKRFRQLIVEESASFLNGTGEVFDTLTRIGEPWNNLERAFLDAVRST